MRLREADRLGLELSLSPQSGLELGWSLLVKPEQAAKNITWSELCITGPTKYAEKLPPPPRRDNLYQDSSVIA